MSLALQRRRRRGTTDPLTKKYQQILAADPEVLFAMEGAALTTWEGTPIYYADPAGTTPVYDVGDPVGGLLDLVTGEIKATQTTDLARPVLGVYSVVFDGDKLVSVDAFDLSGSFSFGGRWTVDVLGQNGYIGRGIGDMDSTLAFLRDEGGGAVELRLRDGAGATTRVFRPDVGLTEGVEIPLMVFVDRVGSGSVNVRVSWKNGEGAVESATDALTVDAMTTAIFDYGPLIGSIKNLWFRQGELTAHDFQELL